MSTKRTAVTNPVPNTCRKATGRGIPAAALALAVLLPLAAPAESEVPAAGRELTLTFYRGNVALIQDRRDAAPLSRRDRARWRDVAPGLHPGSVRLEGGGAVLRGFALEHEPWSLAGLVEAHVGRQVRVVRGAGADREEIRARVVAADPLLLESVNGVFSARPDQLVYPGGVPAGMGAKPALVLELDRAEDDGSAPTLNYLADGFDWSAEHVAILSPQSARMDLVTRARIRNDSGMAVEDARVHLIAGEVNIPRDGERPVARQTMLYADMAESAPQQVVPEVAGEQYRFRLPQPLTLADGDSRSVRLRSHDGIAVERIHAVTAAVQLRGQSGAGGWQTVPVETRLEWEQPDGPLPAGPVRVYEREQDGLRLVGGDGVPDRPEGERVRIVPARPFDLTAERRQTEFRRIDSRRYEAAHEIRLSNATGEPAEIRVEEAIPGDWEMLRASDDWERAAANLAVWRVEVPAGGEQSITYHVRINQ